MNIQSLLLIIIMCLLLAYSDIGKKIRNEIMGDKDTRTRAEVIRELDEKIYRFTIEERRKEKEERKERDAEIRRDERIRQEVRRER